MFSGPMVAEGMELAAKSCGKYDRGGIWQR